MHFCVSIVQQQCERLRHCSIFLTTGGQHRSTMKVEASHLTHSRKKLVKIASRSQSRLACIFTQLTSAFREEVNNKQYKYLLNINLVFKTLAK